MRIPSRRWRKVSALLPPGPPAEPVAPPEATGVLAAIAEPATSNFTGTVVSNLPLAGLTIAPGWTVREGARPGDYEVISK